MYILHVHVQSNMRCKFLFNNSTHPGPNFFFFFELTIFLFIPRMMEFSKLAEEKIRPSARGGQHVVEAETSSTH